MSKEEVFLEPNGMPATCSMLMRTDAIKKYPSEKLRCPVGDRNRRMFLAHLGDVVYIDDLMSVYRVNNSNSFGGQLYDYNKSKKLVDDMFDFFDRFNRYTDYQYADYIEYLKDRELIAHYSRFDEYEKIVKLGYYKRYYSNKSKLKILIKLKLSGIYNIYRIINKLDK